MNHGQIETCLLAIPEESNLNFEPERLEEIRISLTEQGTNLIPLMVRRSDAYGDNFEYEVIYGEEWCVVAQELDIDRLWVWMFDLDDEQAQVARAEMVRLAGGKVVIPPVDGGKVSPPPSPLADPSIARRMEEKIQQLSKQFERVETVLKAEQKSLGSTEIVVPQLEKFEERFGHLESAIQGLRDREPLQPTVTKVDSQPLAEVLNRALDAIAAGKIRVQITLDSPKSPGPDPDPDPIDKMSRDEVKKELDARAISYTAREKVSSLREKLKQARREGRYP